MPHVTHSETELFSAMSPSGEVTARPMRRRRLSSLRLLRTNTRQRELSRLAGLLRNCAAAKEEEEQRQFAIGRLTGSSGALPFWIL